MPNHLGCFCDLDDIRVLHEFAVVHALTARDTGSLTSGMECCDSRAEVLFAPCVLCPDQPSLI